MIENALFLAVPGLSAMSIILSCDYAAVNLSATKDFRNYSQNRKHLDMVKRLINKIRPGVIENHCHHVDYQCHIKLTIEVLH